MDGISFRWRVGSNCGYSQGCRAQHRERHLFFGKTSACTSMPTAPNDLNIMHCEIHTTFRSQKHDYDNAPDPIGPAYEQAKVYWQQYVTRSSFKTLWKFIATSEPFLSSTFRKSNFVNSFVVAGIYPRSDVVLRHCPAFYKKALETTVRYFFDSFEEGSA